MAISMGVRVMVSRMVAPATSKQTGDAEGPVVAAGGLDDVTGDDRRRDTEGIAAHDEDAHRLAGIFGIAQQIVHQRKVERNRGRHSGQRDREQRQAAARFRRRKA